MLLLRLVFRRSAPPTETVEDPAERRRYDEAVASRLAVLNALRQARRPRPPTANVESWLQIAMRE
jgi:hypothetical protein